MQGHTWLPDGSGLIYASATGTTMRYPATVSLRTVSLDGTIGRQLTFGDVWYMHPDLVQGHGLLASRVWLQSDIWRFPVSGSPQMNVQNGIRITHQTGQVQTPSVSPDGKEVAYLRIAVDMAMCGSPLAVRRYHRARRRCGVAGRHSAVARLVRARAERRQWSCSSSFDAPRTRTGSLRCYTSLKRPDAYLCSRLEISVWSGNPSASARFSIASRSLLDSRMLSRDPYGTSPSRSESTERARACHPWRTSTRRARRTRATPSRRRQPSWSGSSPRYSFVAFRLGMIVFKKTVSSSSTNGA